jgi:hypothetical protein
MGQPALPQLDPEVRALLKRLEMVEIEDRETHAKKKHIKVENMQHQLLVNQHHLLVNSVELMNWLHHSMEGSCKRRT